jgi:DNA-binding MarR family transcriptional regulator
MPPAPQPTTEEDLADLELEGADPLSARVFAAFFRVLRLHRNAFLRVLAEEGSHPGQAICLRIVARRDGLSQRELGAMLHLTPPTVTSMLQRMERSGLIQRRPDPDDQRVARIHITPDGRAAERSARAAMVAHVRQAIDPIPQDDRRELARLLDLLGDQLAEALR